MRWHECGQSLELCTRWWIIDSPALGAGNRLRAKLKCIPFGRDRRLLLSVFAGSELVSGVGAVGLARLRMGATRTNEEKEKGREPHVTLFRATTTL